MDSLPHVQISAIDETNYPLAVICLSISLLPALYSRCDKSHLASVAARILQAFVQCSKSCDELEESNLQSVVMPFVHSEKFQEMRKLHELLLNICCSDSARLLPKW